MESHAPRPWALGRAIPQRVGAIRHMVSTPVMNSSYDTTYTSPPIYHRHSVENLGAYVPGLSLHDTISSISPKKEVFFHKQSLKDFLKAQLQLGTLKSIRDEKSRHFRGIPDLRDEFLSWLRGRTKHVLRRYPSSSGSGLDPELTCRGLPDMQDDTTPNTPASPYPYTSPSSASATAKENDTSHFKVTKKVSNKNMSNADANDESLQRYKQSLGLGGGKDLSDPNDPRVCIINSLTMESPGRAPVTIDLSAPGSEATLKDKPFKIKEGCKFTMVASFKVQHEILSGLQYVQVVKRKGIKVSKDSEMLVSIS